MEAPINITVESPDAKQAELVGRAIGQSLRENYGFTNVVVADIVHDMPGFRAWSVHDSESEGSLLDAMRDSNPGVFEAPVTVLSRHSENLVMVFPQPEDAEKGMVTLDGIGLIGVTIPSDSVVVIPVTKSEKDGVFDLQP